MNIKTYICTISILLLLPVSIFAQSLSDKELELEDNAYELFFEKEFNEALPIFSQLLSLYPKKADYNYGYGACLVEVNKELNKAIQYLKYASDKSSNPVINYYLGVAYHQSYDFNKAIKKYSVFKRGALASELKNYPVDKKIKECENGNELIKLINDLVVTENKKIDIKKFYYSYNLDDFGGKIIIKPEEFKTKLDKKKLPKSIMFLPSKTETVFFSSYGSSKKNSLDIYQKTKLEDGSWSEPIKLGVEINTNSDEDYPFIHQNGKTLFFSSKGRNSMGGYDIFKTEYDSTEQKWSEAINMNFPINSPYNDILYITDKDEDYAYFASSRETYNKEISVYKIIVDKNPVLIEIDDFEVIKRKALLDISPLADITKAEKSIIVFNETLKNIDDKKILSSKDYTPSKTSHSYNFEKLENNNNFSEEELKTFVKSDALAIKQKAEETKKDVSFAYLLANKTNNRAIEKKNELDNINSRIDNLTNGSEKDNLFKNKKEVEKELMQLEKESVVAYNLASNIENTANEKLKEVEKTVQLADKLQYSSATKEELIKEINTSRDALNRAQGKYTSVEGEKENRKAALNRENNLLNDNISKQKDLKKDLKNLSAEKIILKQEIIIENDPAKKSELQKEINSVNSEYDDIILLNNKIIKDIEGTKQNIADLSTEISYLEELEIMFDETTGDIAIITEEYNKIDKDALKQMIYDNEINYDEKSAEIIANNIVTEVNNQSQDLVNYENNYNENILAENTKIETKTEAITNNQTNKQNTEETEPDTNINQNTENTKIGAENNLAENIKSEIKTEATTNNQTDKQNTENPKTENSLANNTETEDKADTNVNQNTENTNTVAENNLAENIETETKTEATTNNQIDKQNTKLTEKQEYKQKTIKADIDKLYLQASNNKQISDSLSSKAKQKQDLLANINNENEKATLLDEIGDLYELAEIKRAQSDSQFKNAKEKEINLLASNITESNIDANDNSISINKTPKPELIAEYDNSFLNKIYYENKLAENNNKIEILEKNINERKNKSDIKVITAEIDKLILENKNLDKLLAENTSTLNKIITESDNQIKELSINDNNTLITSDLEIKNNASLTESQIETTEEIDYKSEEIESLESELHELEKDILLAEIELSDESISEKSANKLETKLASLNTQKAEVYSTYSNTIAEKNKYEFTLMSELLNENKKQSTNLSTSNTENEANTYFEKAQTIRSNSNNYDTKTKQQEIEKAVILEKIALQKQKYLLNTYTPSTESDIADKNNNSETNIAETTTITRDIEELEKLKAELLIRELGLKKKDLKHLKRADTDQEIVNANIIEVSNIEKEITDVQFIMDNAINTTEKNNAKYKIKDLNEQKNDLLFLIDENQENINGTKYDIYRKNIKNIIPKEKTEQTKQAKTLVNDAQKDFSKAEALREKAMFTDNPKRALESLIKASELEIKSIEAYEKAIVLYSNLQTNEEYTTLLAETNNATNKSNEESSTIADETESTKTEKNIAQASNASKSTEINESYDNISVKIDAPDIIKAGDEFIVSITIKNNIGADNFARFQHKLPTGFTAKGLDLGGSNYTFENQKAKFFWINFPKDGINFSYNVTTDKTIEGDFKIEGLFSCIDSGKVSMPIEQLNIKVTPWAENTKYLSDNTETETKIEPKDETKAENNETIAKTKNTNITELKYSILPVPAYSKSNPIPMNISLPGGIIFKIQIGAFKTKIRQDAFNGLNPVTGEKLQGSAFTKYLVGLFKTLEGSRVALSEVKTMGYKDAFIVAYKDGKRVPIYKARNIVNSSSNEYKILAQAEVNQLKSRVRNNTTASNQNTYLPEQTENTKIVEAINVNTVDGLFYTVQIGVYKKPIAHSRLYNIKPIYEEKTEYGFIRYTTGIFDNKSKAVLEKNRIAKLGIADAFVTAYYKGRKLSNYDITKLIAENTKFASTSDIKLPEQKPTKKPIVNTQNASIVFKVQIGAYRENIPLSEVTALISASRLNELDTYKNENGYTIYSVGNFKEYSGALSMKEILINEGIPDAFITAYNNGKKVSVKDAIEVLAN